MALNLALFTAGAGWRVRIGLNTFSQMLVFVCLIDRASFGFGGVAGRVLEARPVVYVGTISYGLYLYHEFVPPAVRRLSDAWSLDWGLPPHGWLRFLVVGLVTLGVAALSWHLFERPLTGLKRYIPYVGRARPRRAAGPAGLVTAAFHEA
jgi:peptidoglycan/LPS O-acetylase OafA/YrhL